MAGYIATLSVEVYNYGYEPTGGGRIVVLVFTKSVG